VAKEHCLIRDWSIPALIAGTIGCGCCNAPAPAASGSANGGGSVSLLSGAAVPAKTLPDRSDPRLSMGNPLWAIPLPTLSVTRERPLFSPSRRPPQPKVVLAAPPSPPSPPKPELAAHPPLSLVGTVRGKAMTIAIFFDQANNSVVRLRAGEGHAGWVLRTIRDREALFEKEGRLVTFTLRGPAASRVAASKPPERLAASSQTDSAEPSPSPDRSPSLADAAPPVPFSASWRDGDGQLIGPPPAKTAEDGKSPPIWLDGYGRPTGPAPTTWSDGDGQSVAPPPYRWLDKDGSPVVPPPFVWRDGDGQLISPPLN
jgi:general secretion pathway protein N